MLTQSLLEIIKLCTNARISELHYQVIDINIRLKCNMLLNKLIMVKAVKGIYECKFI